jgi:transcription antitermination factor NusG
VPLLARETELFPDDLFSLADDVYRWAVAHVRSRQEKVLGRYLFERGIPFYAPVATKTTERSGRTFKSYLPLFPGYVFLRLPADGRDQVLRSNVTAHLIDVDDQAGFAAELAQIRQLQLSGAVLTPYPEFVTGDFVRISEGSFRGYVGVVVQEKGSHRLVVRVGLLNQAVSVELGRGHVTKAKSEDRSVATDASNRRPRGNR